MYKSSNRDNGIWFICVWGGGCIEEHIALHLQENKPDTGGPDGKESVFLDPTHANLGKIKGVLVSVESEDEAEQIADSIVAEVYSLPIRACV